MPSPRRPSRRSSRTPTCSWRWSDRLPAGLPAAVVHLRPDRRDRRWGRCSAFSSSGRTARTMSRITRSQRQPDGTWKINGCTLIMDDQPDDLRAGPPAFRASGILAELLAEARSRQCEGFHRPGASASHGCRRRIPDQLADSRSAGRRDRRSSRENLVHRPSRRAEQLAISPLRAAIRRSTSSGQNIRRVGRP